MHIKRFIAIFVALFALIKAEAQQNDLLVNGRDTIRYTYTPLTTEPAKKSGWQKFCDYYRQSTTDNTDTKRFDVTVVGAPTYSSTIGLGLGIMAAGLYRIDREDFSLPPSTVSLFARATLRGVYVVGAEGVNIFKNDRNRILYRLSFASKPTNFWGIGYDAAVTNPAVKYTSNNYQTELSYYHRLCRNLYIGTRLNFDYIYAKKSDVQTIMPYIGSGSSNTLSTGISILIEYDSRDFIPNPQRGVFIALQTMLRPHILASTDSNCWRFTGTASYYQRLWKGATLALDLYAESNSSTTPWQFYAQMGSKSRMRGYYEGRFIDRNMVTTQVELRQNIWQRLGVAVWGGAGNCFSSPDSFQWGHTMPNYGIGLRWELKNRLNIRFDYGFGGVVNGKLINGLQVQLGEAF
jgi:hypothetical protein